MLHVVYRVGDLQKHIDFYSAGLGMKLLRQRDIPEGKYSNAFLGYVRVRGWLGLRVVGGGGGGKAGSRVCVWGGHGVYVCVCGGEGRQAGRQAHYPRQAGRQAL